MRLTQNPPLGALAPQRFLKQIWQRKPLFVRHALPELATLLNRDQLFDLADSDEVESRLVIRNGKAWRVQHGPFKRRALRRLPARNWTLLVNGVENFLPEARALQAAFAFIPAARHDDIMISYAAPGGSVGPHFDSYDVFLVQAMGQRRWQISAQRDLALIEDAPLKLLRNFSAKRSMTAQAGDVLYLPPRYAHHGVALDACMTWSVGLRAPTHQEFAVSFLDFLHDRLQLEGTYRDPDLFSQGHPAALSAAMIEHMAQTLNALQWNRTAVAQCLGQYLTEPRAGILFPRRHQPLPAKRFNREVVRHGLRLALKTRLLFHGRMFFINGETVKLPTADRRLFQQLADHRCLSAQSPASTVALGLLYDWYRSGYLELGSA
jgi:50S ribosomal protein L16 3-hydroxylase